MEELLRSFCGTKTFAVWERRYHTVVSVKDTEITVEIVPFPPDTYDSIREEMVNSEMEKLVAELKDDNVLVRINYETCALFADSFCFHIISQN